MSNQLLVKLKLNFNFKKSAKILFGNYLQNS